MDLLCSKSAPKFIFCKMFKKLWSCKFCKNFSNFKNANIIHIQNQDGFSSRIKRILFHVHWLLQLTRCSYFIISLINMIFQVYKSFSVKFCTLMFFQGGLIKFGIFKSILLWNILLMNILHALVYDYLTAIWRIKICSFLDHFLTTLYCLSKPKI